jgi:FSR family fosmidomycin resistance protein-like MFS transporter
MAYAGVLFSAYSSGTLSTEVVTYLFITYNLLAFGLQVFAGFLTDYLKAPRFTALTGLIITGISTVVLLPFPVAAVVLAGIGNALFHVGGGVISLNLTPQKATAPGIFVAPGALGLMAGTLLGKNGDFIAWPFLLVIVVLCAMIFLVKKPAMYREQPQTILEHGAMNIWLKAEYIIFMVLFVIAVRSLVGFAVSFPWKTDITLLVFLTLAIALGKGLGGFLADRFGWTKVTIGSLLVSIPLLNLGADVPVLGMTGMFLFNITMPVTLVLVSNMLPGRPGTAFGLACMALVLGTLPAFSEFRAGLNNHVLIDVIIAISAVTLFLALRYYYKEQRAVKG